MTRDEKRELSKREPMKRANGDKFADLATEADGLLRSMEQVEEELLERIERLREGATR